MISGNISIFLAALGHKEGASAILPSIEQIGVNFILEEFNFDDVHNVYYKFNSEGVEFNFENEFLRSIMFYLAPEDGYSSYKNIPDLITGLTSKSTRTNILNDLGEPFLQGGNPTGWLKYKIGTNYIHFEFNNNSILKKITLIH